MEKKPKKITGYGHIVVHPLDTTITLSHSISLWKTKKEALKYFGERARKITIIQD